MLVFVSLLGHGMASADVRVVLIDGKQVRADRIGPETDNRRIALRMETDHMILTRLIPWQRVVWVRIGDRTYSAGEIRGVLGTDEKLNRGRQKMVRTVSTEPASPQPSGKIPGSVVAQDDTAFEPVDCRCLPPVLPIDARIIGIREDPLSAYRDSIGRHFPHGVPLSETDFALHLMRARKVQEVLDAAGHSTAAGRKKSIPPVPARQPPREFRNNAVESISVEAFPISRHGKVDWDALVVDIHAFDRFGGPKSVGGTVQITLRGTSQKFIHASGFRTLGRPGRVEKIANWTRMIRPPSNRLILPLPRPLPEHDLRLAPLGELHVRLLVPGRGILETTQRNVLLRHISQLRDRQLEQTGSRFFPNEATHDSRRFSSLDFRIPAALRP